MSLETKDIHAWANMLDGMDVGSTYYFGPNFPEELKEYHPHPEQVGAIYRIETSVTTNCNGTYISICPDAVRTSWQAATAEVIKSIKMHLILDAEIPRIYHQGSLEDPEQVSAEFLSGVYDGTTVFEGGYRVLDYKLYHIGATAERQEHFEGTITWLNINTGFKPMSGWSYPLGG